jgi:hypothetical protein
MVFTKFSRGRRPSRRMAAKSSRRLLPVPCGAGKLATAVSFPLAATVGVVVCTVTPRQRCRVALARLNRLVERWIPAPRVLHPYPITRFTATHPRWKPYARVTHVRFCAVVAGQPASLPRQPAISWFGMLSRESKGLHRPWRRKSLAQLRNICFAALDPANSCMCQVKVGYPISISEGLTLVRTFNSWTENSNHARPLS